MRRGVRLLESDEHPEVRRAFAMANRAMLMQMVHTGEDFSGRRKLWTDSLPAVPDYDDATRAWRPFQLAFLLLTIESVALDESPDRDLVDLIWFPTGGGKTEAYLGLVAFTIFHRRLLHGERGRGDHCHHPLHAPPADRPAVPARGDPGLRVRAHPQGVTGHLGQPANLDRHLGRWRQQSQHVLPGRGPVGARSRTKSGRASASRSTCARGAEPRSSQTATRRTKPTRCTPANDSFRMACANPDCDFHDHLPVSSVDEDLYDNPPTVLIGTVDKFARLTWEGRAGVFLGAGDDPGPSLVIQDELHLISGPLGTIVGLYEAAFDVVMRRHGARPEDRSLHRHHPPCRRAGPRRLRPQGRHVPAVRLGRGRLLFRAVRPRQARAPLLRGHAAGHTPLTAMVHLSAALLQAPMGDPPDSPGR